MKLHASGEDYLEAILVIQKKLGMVRSVDVARHMELSKPSVSVAVNTLKKGGFLIVDLYCHMVLELAAWYAFNACYSRSFSTYENFANLCGKRE